MPGSWRSYTEQERASAVGLALAMGTKKAALETGIPRRTLSAWLKRPSPQVKAAIIASDEAIGLNLRTAAARGSAVLNETMDDPRTPARVKVEAADIALRNYTLWSGRATSRTETMTPADSGLTSEQKDQLARFLDWLEAASDAELRNWGVDGGLERIRSGIFTVLPLVNGRVVDGQEPPP